jgi:hypothetical protein
MRTSILLIALFLGTIITSCKKTKFPSTIKIVLIDTLTGLPIPNIQLNISQVQNPIFTDKETYRSNGLFTLRKPKRFTSTAYTNQNGYCEFELEKNRMEYVSIWAYHLNKSETELGYFDKYIPLSEINRKDLKEHVYKAYLFPQKQNLAYRVVLKFLNSPGWGGYYSSDSIYVTKYKDDYPFTKENIEFELKIKRGQNLIDSSGVFYEKNDNKKLTGEITIEYLGVAKGKKYISNCDAYKTTKLEPDKLNRIVIEIP